MYKIAVGINPITQSQVTASGIHGVFFDALTEVDEDDSTWLHNLPGPKPYSIRPFYKDRMLVGIQMSAVTKDIANMIVDAWELAEKTQKIREENISKDINKPNCNKEDLLRFGTHPIEVKRVKCVNGVSYSSLLSSIPVQHATLSFITPTAFKSRDVMIKMPYPKNVFERPFKVWQQYAPSLLQLPYDWLDWCEKNVYIDAHSIYTEERILSKRNRKTQYFKGFVGNVTFATRTDNVLYQSTLTALVNFSAYTGIGYKTGWGMGSVEVKGLTNG